jgi:GTP diphosphokinase / guanosine-3',5'-bis(diphosphate) 3'-diphosphatase
MLPVLLQGRTQAAADHACYLSQAAKLVTLAKKICDSHDMSRTAPAGWRRARRPEYFDRAKQVSDELRAVQPTLEPGFDAEFARRPY